MPEVPEGFPRFREVKEKVEKTEAQQRGINNRRKGAKKQREARKTLEKALGVESSARYAGLTANEESWRLAFRVEVKAGKQVGPIETRYKQCEDQSELNHHSPKAVGDTRPFVMVAMPDGWGSDGLVIFRLSNLERVFEIGRLIEGK